ncbi:MAG: hypothetical protein WDO56_08595 [Gammaproteobacteria bacterium]
MAASLATDLQRLADAAGSPICSDEIFSGKGIFESVAQEQSTLAQNCD